MPTQRVRERGSRSTRILERAWERLREVISGLPAAVIVPMDARSRRRARGHFAPSTWRVRGPRHAHEVAISPELFSTPDALLATMVHEAVHALLYANDQTGRHIGGVSRDGYYHRREFRNACRTLGLECEYLNGRYGWTITHWPPAGVPERYRAVVALLARLPFGGGRGVVRRHAGRPTPVSGQVRLQCRCVPARTVYVARSQAARGGIVCSVCRNTFEGAAEIRTPPPTISVPIAAATRGDDAPSANFS